MPPSNIREVLEHLGVSGRESGEEMNAPCPLHGDHRPSFSVNVETGLWTCYAGCGGGNLFQLAERITGSRVKARRMVSFYSPRTLRAMTTPLDFEIVDEDVLRDITREPPASELRRRRISAEVARELSIRYNPWNPAPGGTGKPGTDPAWVIPLRSPEDYGLIGWQTKGTVTGEAFTTGKKNMTLFGVELGGVLATFGTSVGTHQKKLLQELAPCIVVESPLDVAVIRTAGITDVVGFIIALDNDGPGRKATASMARNRDIAARFVFNYERTPDAKDPGDMTHAEIIWAIDNAIPAAKWLTDHADKATA